MDDGRNFGPNGGRRKQKQHSENYKRLQNTIQRKIREVKENEKKERCEEIEHYQNRYVSFNRKVSKGNVSKSSRWNIPSFLEMKNSDKRRNYSVNKYSPRENVLTRKYESRSKTLRTDLV